MAKRRHFALPDAFGLGTVLLGCGAFFSSFRIRDAMRLTSAFVALLGSSMSFAARLTRSYWVFAFQSLHQPP